MTPTPYLFFNGTCREALTFYASVFGGSPELMAAGGMPDMEIPADKADWIMHGSLKMGDGMLMASDNLFGESAKMEGCSVMVDAATAAEARAAFDKLAEGGEITMPFEATFWSAGFGTCVDRFGTRWMVGTSEEPGS